jgi:6-pyruvoyltetrahydropterin/6-carboxytetrahydropterin synthase
MMYQITKTFTFCYGHRLYKDSGKCGHLHGHTGRAEVTLEGKELDHLGMLKNFDSIKAGFGKWIDANLDHRLLLNKSDPLVEPLKKAGEKLFLMDGNPTAENIAKVLHETAKGDGLPVKNVTFWESPTACATYSK